MGVNKRKLFELVEWMGQSSVEEALLQRYILDHALNVAESHFLRPLSDIFVNPFLQQEVEQLGPLTLKELESSLEVLIHPEDRKLNGAHFTPSVIIQGILQEVRPQPDERILDPSCGSGAFLVEAADYLHTTYGLGFREIIQNRLFGVDILEYNVRRAKVLLCLLALEHGEVIYEEDLNLRCDNSLLADFSEIFPRNEEGIFDVVIGNPPYVRFQDLSEETRSQLVTRWESISFGTFNLYFAFFELGYTLLSPDGRLGFITPNNYFTSLAGKSLRSYFQTRRCVSKIVDFHCKRVFDAQTYTALTFLSRAEQSAIEYARVKSSESIRAFLEINITSPNPYENLNSTKWRLLSEEEQVNIQKLENSGVRLGQAMDIRVGIATLKDELYFVDGSKRRGRFLVKRIEEREYLIESEITRPIYKISDFKSAAECETNNRRIIFPYRVSKGSATAISESDIAKLYPKCYEYLQAVLPKLAERSKGKLEVNPWYAYGRTQGLARVGVQIVTPTFSKSPRFLSIPDSDALFCNGYGLFYRIQEDQNLFEFCATAPLFEAQNKDVLCRFLNSRIMDYYVSRTSVSIEGDYPCYQKNFIENLTIPAFSELEVQELRGFKDTNAFDGYLERKYGLEFTESLSVNFEEILDELPETKILHGAGAIVSQ